MEPYIRFRASPADPYALFLLCGPDQCLDEEPYHCRLLVGVGQVGDDRNLTQPLSHSALTKSLIVYWNRNLFAEITCESCSVCFVSEICAFWTEQNYVGLGIG